MSKTMASLLCAALLSGCLSTESKQTAGSNTVAVNQVKHPAKPVKWDDPYMMPYYTGEIIPTPKKARYKNEYI